MDTTFVSLDLELLESADHGQEILEIGAVRFRTDQELDNLSALVQTVAPLSHRIKRLTGIAEADLDGAVPLGDAVRRLERFVGSTPVVGQSIELDAEQLERAGLQLRVPLIDTFELAGLLLPGRSAYDLESIAVALGVEVGDDRHRALGDARLAMRVFNCLSERVRRLDLDMLAQICRLSLPLNWPLRMLFAEAERRKVRDFTAGSELRDIAARSGPAWLAHAPEPSQTRDVLVPNERFTLLDVDALEQSMRQGGQLSAQLADFEERPEQVEMLRAVATAFNDSENLVVEAGTGTGKSLAYLLPSIKFAQANNRRVVVSTNTINLQDQLSQQELPALKKMIGDAFKFSVLKGRSNYLCLRRWEALLRAEELAQEDRSLLIKTLLWLPETKTGDRVELRLAGREEQAWSKICAAADVCSPRHCAYNRAGRCFITRARRAAEASHLIVVNHSLLLADLGTRSRVLPEYRHLVIDEAHHLEDEATSQLGWQLGVRELVANLERLWEVGPSRSNGIVPQAVALLRRIRANDAAALDRLSAEIGYAVGALAEELPRFFDLLRRFVDEHGQRSETGAPSSRLTASTRTQPAWSEVEIAWDNQNQRLLKLQRGLGDLLRTMEALDSPSDEWEELTGELALQASFWDGTRERLWSAIVEPDERDVTWLTLARNQELYVNTAPLHVGEQLRDSLLGEKSCVIFTSATLTAARSFRYLRERLGIDDARELILGSPFDYEHAAIVYLPTDLPEPNSSGYQAAVERITGQVIAALDGRTLVLFTSYSQLRATYNALREPLEARRILLLGQRMDGASRARQLETFRQGERVALMGTASFWEGVDVVGEALSCLIIARLPFSIPSDPVFQARSEAFEDPFGEYAVPQAILRFRQGIGRLIRSRSDRGVIVVLDSRLKSRAYGRAFLASLPGCDVHAVASSKMASVAREWLDAAPAATGV